MDLSLNYYLTLLLSVRTQVVAGKKKVAKPLFLLAIIHAIEKNLITKNEIKYTDDLECIYIHLFQRYGVDYSPMKYPFYHLKSDGFYHIKGNLTTNSPTSKQLKEKVEFAYFDEQLWMLLQDKCKREEVIESIESFFNLISK